MKWRTSLVWGLVTLGILGWIFGPKPERPNYFVYEESLFDLPLTRVNDSLRSFENAQGALNCAAAEVIWYDDTVQTEYSILYLHGFSATKQEGEPMHRLLAAEFGMNLYLARMQGHGLDEPDSLRFLKYTATRVWQKSVQDFRLAAKLGRKVIIMSCSTGSPVALRLASQFPEHVVAVMNYSPNFGITRFGSSLANGPWGLQLLRALNGGQWMRTIERNSSNDHMNCLPDAYRWESVTEMQQVVETMSPKRVLERVTCPSFTAVWYANEDSQDPVVDIGSIRKMHDMLGSDEKYWFECDCGNHVILNQHLSREFNEVYEASSAFLNKVIYDHVD